MNIKSFLLSSAIIVSQSSFAQTPAEIVGSWNVTLTSNGDTTLKSIKKGDISSYIWIISVNRDGSVQVSVQGETKFPKLTGHYFPNTKTMILEARSTQGLNVHIASWYKLHVSPNGEMLGVRRYLSDGPEFADFEITAKRQQ